MRKLKYTEEIIVGILSEVEAGITVSELCKTHGISDTTCRSWMTKYDRMTAKDIKRLQEALPKILGFNPKSMINLSLSLQFKKHPAHALASAELFKI
jgi:Transposase